MNNPLAKNDLWVTPKSMKELQQMLEECGTSQATHAAALTWNYCSELVQQAIDNEAKLSKNQKIVNEMKWKDIK